LALIVREILGLPTQGHGGSGGRVTRRNVPSQPLGNSADMLICTSKMRKKCPLWTLFVFQLIWGSSTRPKVPKYLMRA